MVSTTCAAVSNRSDYVAQPAQTEKHYVPFPTQEGRNWLHAGLEVPTLVRLFGLRQPASVLEIGCGRGVALSALARLCAPGRLAGIDTDGEALAAAQERLARCPVPVTLIHGDARAMPFPDGSFEVVLDFGTCYHIGRPEAALREIERVLRPGGLFLHETRVAQATAHPFRAFGGTLPWHSVAHLRPQRWRLFWGARTRTA